MNLQLKIEHDRAGQRMAIYVIDTDTNTVHGEYGSISLSLLDLAKNDLPKIGAAKLTQFGVGTTSPLYMMATGNQMLGSDGNLHPVWFQEVKTCVAGVQRTVITLVSTPFKGAGDP